MFEGDGAQVRNNLYERFTEQFVGERFILATNKVPLSAHVDHDLHESQWGPMLERVVWVDFVARFDSANPCPYDAPTLAGAINQLRKAVLRYPDAADTLLLELANQLSDPPSGQA